MAEQAVDPAYANENRAWVTITVASIMLFLATTSVVLRSYTRFSIVGHFGMDDCAAVITMVSCRSPHSLSRAI